jgi:NADH-quinone oxidoreductase subunit H
LRYDQFMALGWKRLIPVSLLWILVVAVLRETGVSGVFPNLIAAAVLLGVLLGLNALRRKRMQRDLPPPPPPPAAGGFPVPPLPITKATSATSAKEAANV